MILMLLWQCQLNMRKKPRKCIIILKCTNNEYIVYIHDTQQTLCEYAVCANLLKQLNLKPTMMSATSSEDDRKYYMDD